MKKKVLIPRVYKLLFSMLQMTLLGEIRNLVHATDLDKFDNLLERREVSFICSTINETNHCFRLCRGEYGHSMDTHKKHLAEVFLVEKTPYLELWTLCVSRYTFVHFNPYPAGLIVLPAGPYYRSLPSMSYYVLCSAEV